DDHLIPPRFLMYIKMDFKIYKCLGLTVVLMRVHLPKTLPIPVNAALQKLGDDIRNARRRRRIPTAVMAERAFVTRTTLGKVEKGDPGVSIGTYATVLFILGMKERLSDLAD